MCEICETNKKLGVSTYLCIKKICESAKDTKPTKIINIPLRKENDIPKS